VPALFVSHHPGRAFLNESPMLALRGSLSLSLHHAEIVVINLYSLVRTGSTAGEMKMRTISKLKMEPLPTRINPTYKYLLESVGQALEFIVHFVHV
jgi:hypothetical protein